MCPLLLLFLSPCDTHATLYLQEFPSVVQLPVHLRDRQFVVFNATRTASAEQVEHDAKDTRLTAFFKANQRYLFALC
ncbi:hypothetical protein EDB89DRAFT_1927617, partial [Lactarius sanguifluus]